MSKERSEYFKDGQESTKYTFPDKFLNGGQAWKTLIISQSQRSPHFADSVALRKLIFLFFFLQGG